MTKDESKILQGVALLLMVFLHLFNWGANVNLCTNLIHISGKPIVSLLSRAANPVPFFLILSGYGLHFNNPSSVNKLLKRTLRLFIYFWLALLIFVCLGSFIKPDIYPGSYYDILMNITGINYSYNNETWFFLPYILISLSSNAIFKLMHKIGPLFSIICATGIYLITLYTMGRYSSHLVATNKYYLMQLLAYFNFLLPFILGGWLQEYSKNHTLKFFGDRYNFLPISLLVLLISVKTIYRTAVFDPYYALLFILLFLNVRRWRFLDVFLKEMGDKSMIIWLIHTYFCYYLFKEFIYGFKFPLLIYMVTLSISYLAALPIKYLADKIVKLTLPAKNRVL